MRKPCHLENPEKGWDEEIGRGFQGDELSKINKLI
jgi:hypothetical protein